MDKCLKIWRTKWLWIQEKEGWFVWNFKKNRNCNKNLLQDLEYVKKEFVKYINKN